LTTIVTADTVATSVPANAPGVAITITANTTDQGLTVSQTGMGQLASTPPTAVGYAYNHISVPADRIDARDIAAGANVTNGLLVDIYPKGNDSGRSNSLNNAITGLTWVVPSSGIGTVVEKGINGVWGLSITEDNFGGSNGNWKGGVFGMNAQAVAKNGATYLLGTVGIEVDVTAASGSSMSRREGITLCDLGSAVQGTDVDAAIGIRNSGGLGWKNGLLFHDTNPVSSSGKLIATAGSSTVAYGVDISSYTFSAAAFKSPGFTVGGGGHVEVSALYAAISLDGTGTAPRVNLSINGTRQSFIYDDGSEIVVASNNAATHGSYIVHGTDSWVGVSDRRLKDRIKTYSVLDKLDDYRAVSYVDKRDGKTKLGVIAQEQVDIFPEFVKVGSGADDLELKSFADEQAWGVSYDKYGVLALMGVKELLARVEAIEQRAART
jgi:hypothetical protein